MLGASVGLDINCRSLKLSRMLVLKQPTTDKVKVLNEEIICLGEKSNNNSNMEKSK